MPGSLLAGGCDLCGRAASRLPAWSRVVGWKGRPHSRATTGGGALFAPPTGSWLSTTQDKGFGLMSGRQAFLKCDRTSFNVTPNQGAVSCLKERAVATELINPQKVRGRKIKTQRQALGCSL